MIKFTTTAKKDLAKLDKQSAKRIISFLQERIKNNDNPRTSGKALTGTLGGLWRYRVGDFRIICELQEGVLCVLVLKIRHRREVYRT